MKHKPNCSSNISCLVYHLDGVCPGYKSCDCGVEAPQNNIAMTTKPEPWEKEFDEQQIFCCGGEYHEDAHTDRQLAFIRTQIAKAKQEERERIAKKIGEMRMTWKHPLDRSIEWKTTHNEALNQALASLHQPEETKT